MKMDHSLDNMDAKENNQNRMRKRLQRLYNENQKTNNFFLVHTRLKQS